MLAVQQLKFPKFKFSINKIKCVKKDLNSVLITSVLSKK